MGPWNRRILSSEYLHSPFSITTLMISSIDSGSLVIVNGIMSRSSVSHTPTWSSGKSTLV